VALSFSIQSKREKLLQGIRTESGELQNPEHGNLVWREFRLGIYRNLLVTEARVWLNQGEFPGGKVI
jgi:hypothetical protein